MELRSAVFVVIVMMLLVTACLPSAAEEFPNWATLNLWAGPFNSSSQWAQWTLTELSTTSESYVANAGNAHVAFYNGAAWKDYYSSPVAPGQSATNFFYVWVDDSYAGDYVDVSWTWTTNGPANAGYQWSTWENYVGGYPSFNNRQLTADHGVLRVRANTTPCATYGAEYLGFTVTNAVPEPSSLIALMAGCFGIVPLLRRRKR